MRKERFFTLNSFDSFITELLIIDSYMERTNSYMANSICSISLSLLLFLSFCLEKNSSLISLHFAPSLLIPSHFILFLRRRESQIFTFLPSFPSSLISMHFTFMYVFDPARITSKVTRSERKREREGKKDER